MPQCRGEGGGALLEGPDNGRCSPQMGWFLFVVDPTPIEDKLFVH